MNTTFRGMGLLVVVACVGVGVFGGAAYAQTVKTGPVKIENDTHQAITLTNFKYIDEGGKEKALDGKVELPARFNGYITANKKTIRASRIEYDVTTADGTTEKWFCVAKALNADEDFACTFTAANLAAHKKQLGVKEAADGPITEERKKQIAAGVVKALLALPCHKAAQKQPKDFGEAFAAEFARGMRDELLKSAIEDLFPDMGKDASRVAGELAGAALDGRMTDPKWSAATAQRKTADHLKAKCPKFESPDELAAFLVGLEAGARQSR